MESATKMLADHPYHCIMEELLDSKANLTINDIKQVIKEDRLHTVTDENRGLINFETMVEKLFDTTETKLINLEKLI